ncbi:hypothetical protein MMC25_005865 [Agyrium rufum]|nr:hypothetical protein [Agyrium rufum]
MRAQAPQQNTNLISQRTRQSQGWREENHYFQGNDLPAAFYGAGPLDHHGMGFEHASGKPFDILSLVNSIRCPTYAAGDSRFERLPVEIHDQIFAHLALDTPPAEYTPRNEDLIACLLASKTLYLRTLRTLYSRVTLPHSLVFAKFLRQITTHPEAGRLVKCLDLSHFTSLGLGRTSRFNLEIPNFTRDTFFQCLSLTPNIRELLLQEHTEDDLSPEILKKVFYGLPRLRALDLCAAASRSFVNAFASAMLNASYLSAQTVYIERLSLHECFTLESSALESLLSRMPGLTHLDLCHTRVTNTALASIPASAHLSHLNLARCSTIKGDKTAEFLTNHPACSSLVYLNLASDITRNRLLWETDLTALLPRLPRSLRSLNINGAKIALQHVIYLQAVSKHLEELSMAHADLTLQNINSLFYPTSTLDNLEEIAGAMAEWIPSTLKYIDLTGITAMKDPGTLFTRSCLLLGRTSEPLQVIEFGESVIAQLKNTKPTGERLGWKAFELGRRGWYARQLQSPQWSINGDARYVDDGIRSWKMGASWWGMRKIPVSRGEVGGLYASYMFKRQ